MKKFYFSVLSWMLLFFSVFGFSDNIFTDISQKSNSDPKFIIHGLFWLAWMIFLVVQSTLIRMHNAKTHMRWGIYGMLVAVGVVLSTLFVFYSIYKGWDAMPSYVKANRINMAAFIVLIYLAYRHRKKPIWHKRFIFVGTFLVMEPILSRVTSKLEIDPEIGVPVISSLLFLSLIKYDWSLLKRVHPITYLGVVWMFLVFFITEYV